MVKERISKERILIVENDINSVNIIKEHLKRNNFQIHIEHDGVAGIAAHAHWRPDLVLLDITLPKLSGNDVLAAIRQHSRTPVIMLTAVNNDTQRINSLLYGADDYVVKPYNPSEVIARIHAVLRRCQQSALSSTHHLRYGKLVLDLNAACAFIANSAESDSKLTELDLTRTEFQLLSLFMTSPCTMFTRSKLLDICQPESDAMERVVDVHIYNLRKKLKSVGINNMLVTVRGQGYRLGNPK
ncbi:response regulator transcription factor [Serratia microhaemolytica]|uniref:response regulator transcription factor n=1 Tax=Serratia microhaemolytica TaxID=2675110 RepID=UPI001F0C2A1C|nr:response regulator transcription factor [Serratia microhaemolytica]